jgi:putative flippase GtrA
MIKKLYNKYRDLIPYAVFGVLSTLVNIGSYWLFAHLIHMGVMPSTILAWLVAIIFVYITNRKWVFHSEAVGPKAISKEIASFLTCRLLTGFVDWGSMFIFTDVLHFNDVAVMTLANIVVIILNYIASKLVIFKRK